MLKQQDELGIPSQAPSFNIFHRFDEAVQTLEPSQVESVPETRRVATAIQNPTGYVSFEGQRLSGDKAVQPAPAINIFQRFDEAKQSLIESGDFKPPEPPPLAIVKAENTQKELDAFEKEFAKTGQFKSSEDEDRFVALILENQNAHRVMEDRNQFTKKMDELKSKLGDPEKMSRDDLNEFVRQANEFVAKDEIIQEHPFGSAYDSTDKERYQRELGDIYSTNSFVAKALKKYQETTEFEDSVVREYNPKERTLNKVNDGDIYLDAPGRTFRQKKKKTNPKTGHQYVDDSILSESELKKINPLADWGEIKRGFQQEIMEEAYKKAISNPNLQDPMHGDNRKEEGWRKSVPDAINRKLPFYKHFVNWSESGPMRAAAKRIESGEGSREDYELAGEYAAFMEKEEGKEWYKKAGDIVAEMPSFMIEFAAAGGATKAKPLISKLVSGERKVNLGGLAKPFMVTAGMAPQVMSNAIDKSMPTLTGDGKGGMTFTGGSDDWMKNAVKGYLDTSIEVLSEMSGAQLGKVFGINSIKKQFAEELAKRSGNAGQGMLGKIASRIKESSAGKLVDKTVKAGGFHGMVEELLEERFGEVLRGLTGYLPEYVNLDEDFGVTGDLISGDIGRIKKGFKQLGIEAVAFSVPGLARGMAGGIEGLAEESKKISDARNKARSERDKLKKSTGVSGAEKIAELDSEIESLSKAEEIITTVEQAVKKQAPVAPQPTQAEAPPVQPQPVQPQAQQATEPPAQPDQSSMMERLSTLGAILSKGSVSRSVAKENGIEGVSIEERTANARAEAEQLKSMLEQTTGGELPPTTGPTPTTGVEDEVRQRRDETDVQVQTQGQGEQGDAQGQVLQGQQEEVVQQPQSVAQKSGQPSSSDIPELGKVLSPEEASRLIAKWRSGDSRSKNGGEDGGEESIRSPMKIVDLPISVFDFPDADYGTHLNFIKETTNSDRVERYTSNKIDTPIYVNLSGNGNPVVSDGGHRLMAAVARGEETVRAIVPQSYADSEMLPMGNKSETTPDSKMLPMGNKNETQLEPELDVNKEGKPTLHTDNFKILKDKAGIGYSHDMSLDDLKRWLEVADGIGMGDAARSSVRSNLHNIPKKNQADFSAIVGKRTGRKDQPQSIGVNQNGEPIFEDENGVRSVGEGDAKVTESVEIRPTRGPDGKVLYRPAVDAASRNDRFKTESEVPAKRTGKKTNVERSVSYAKDLGFDVTPTEAKTADEKEVASFLESRGKSFAFVEADETFGGLTDKDGFVLLRSGREPDRLWKTVGHELAHETGLDKIIPADSDVLKTGMKARLDRATPKYKAVLEKNQDLLEREARADIIGQFFTDKDFRDRLRRTEPTMWEQIVDAVLKMIGKWDSTYEAKSMVLKELQAQRQETPQSDMVSAALDSLDSLLEADKPKKRTGPKQPKAEKADRPKSTGAKKPRKSDQTKAEAKSDMQAAHDAMAELMKKIKGKILSGVDPELMADTVRIAYLYTKANVKTFKGYIEAVVENFGDAFAREIAPYMEAGWEALNIRNIVSDPAGKVTDYLSEKADGKSNDTTGNGNQTSSKRNRRDGENSDGTADADVLEGEPTGDDATTGSNGSSGRVRNRPGGKVRRGSRKTDDSGVDESERGSTDSGGTPTDAAGDGRAGSGIDKAPSVARPNYHLTNPDAIIGGGPKAKFERNRKAIEIVRELESDNRPPTTEELDTLSGYTGWGAFGQELFQGSWENPRVKEGWVDQDEWLRTYLGEEDWKSAQNSIVNAHYTDPQTVTAMWDGLRRMGFKGGRVLEPSMGIGNFFSLMPRDLMERSTLTGIELDKMTANIAKQLHPQANVQQKGYQESNTPDNFYDVIVSNVPFGNYPIPDKRYKQDFSIHNYFFKKAFDQLKPGGVIAFLTSNMSMDGKTQAKLMRAQIFNDGDLVSAIRFPSGAFQAYASTKVVADLIIIRKRKPGEVAGSDKWIDIVDYETPNGETISVNEYWANNPQNILGTMTHGHGTTSGRPGMIVEQPKDLQAALDKAIAKLPENIINTERAKSEGRERSNTTQMRQNSVISQDGELWIIKGEQLLPLLDFTKWHTVKSKPGTIKKNRQEIESLLEVREAMRIALNKQAASEDATAERDELNRVYDDFVKKYGPIAKAASAKHLRKAADPMANTLLALEKKVGGKYVKRPVFERSTVRQRKSIDNPTINDAFAIERNRTLDLDIERIATAAKVSVEDAIKELESAGKIYKTSAGTYDASDVFLRGNMAKKLRQLEAAKAEGVEGLERSIEAVREKIPEPLPYSRVEVQLGAPWIEASDYADFVGYLLNEPSTEIQVERRVNGWKTTIPTAISNKTEAQHTHGHRGIAFSKLMNAGMNNSTVTLTAPDPENPGGRVTDPIATAEANAKIGELREKFSNWIWTSPERITRLSSIYNETRNSTVTPDFSDVPLDFEGLVLERGEQPFNLRSHQASAIWRGVVSGKGIYAHEVGTGKSLTIGGLAMEFRRLGLANKPLLFAHNANSQAVRNEIQEAYPNANILYVNNLDASRKDETLQAIATEDWDLIVIPHSMADRFQMRPETVERLLKPEMDALEAAALEAFEESEASDFAKGEMPTDLNDITDADLKKLREPTAKELVKERLKLRAKIDEATQAMQKGTGMFFEDMGIDMVLVDEAHMFKKLPITTKQRIKGLNINASDRGTMLMMLTDYVRSNNNGRGVFLFTGTPITNTINEIYNMMRYVMAEEMEAIGVRDWDGWFNSFATQETLTELSSGGTWENFDRLSSFVNLPELRQMVGQYMDIVFADDMPEFAPRASRDGRSENPVGRPYKQIHNETLSMSDAQKDYSDELKSRYNTFKNAAGKDKIRMMREPGGRFNPLVIEGEGVKLAMDPRLVGIKVDANDPNLKVNRMLHNAMAHYNEHPKSTQMIFMQIGHNDWAERTVGRDRAGKPIKQKIPVFNVAKEIKRRLIEEGVPENEIALFSGMTAERRTETAQAMREGRIRFAIGSTDTMGTGVNAQDEMVAMHHLDAPWMPGDLEQRNGRGHRQGNKWNTVHEYRYLTEGPQDGRRWQVLLTKSRFIEKFLKSDGSERTIDMEDVDMSEDGSSDMEKTFSAAAGDPRIMMRVRLQGQIEKLERAEDNYARTITETVSRANQKLDYIESTRKTIGRLQSYYQTWRDNKPEDGPVITIRDRQIANHQDANDTLAELETRYQNTIGHQMQIGEYRGIPIFNNNGILFLGENGDIQARWSMNSLQQLMANLPDRISKLEESIGKDERFIKMAHDAVGKPFPKQAQLESKRARLQAILDEMRANPDTSPAWFRNIAPVGSVVYHNGTEYEVAGHRKEDQVLYNKGDGLAALPAKELTDKDGTRLYLQLQDDENRNDDGTGGDTAGFPDIETQDNYEDVVATMLGGRMKMSDVAVTDFEKSKVSSSDVIKSYENVLTAVGKPTPIRSGRGNFKARKAAGWYNAHTEVIRLRTANSIETAAHEIGHATQKLIYGRLKGMDVQRLPTLVRRELVDLGKKLYGDRKPVAGYGSEGFAEFIRLYLTTEDAATEAPSTLSWFQREILENDKTYAKALQKAREVTTAYRLEGAKNRAEANTAKAGGLSQRAMDAKRALSHLPTQLIDEFTPLLNLSKDVEKVAGKLSPSDDPFQVASFLRGAAPSLTHEFVFKGTLDFARNKVGAPLEDAMAIIRGKKTEFSQYLIARRAQELHASGINPGMTREDADVLISLYDSPEFRLAASKVYQWNRDVLLYVRESSPVMQRVVDAIFAKGWENYVPLMREFDDVDVKAMKRLGGIVGNPLKRIKGSGRRIKDIFPQMIANVEKLISAAHRQRVSDTIVKLADVEGMGHIIEEVPVDKVPASATIDQIKSQLESLGIDVPFGMEEEVITIFTPAYTPKGQDPIVPMIGKDGKRRWFQVPEDMYNSMQGLDLYRLPKIVDIVLGVPTRMFRLGTTGLRPAFSLVTNPTRDIQVFGMQSKESNPAKLTANYFVALAQALDPRRVTGKRSSDLDLFYRLGVNLAQPLGVDSAVTRRTANELFQGPVRRVVMHPIEMARELLSVSESVPRVAEIRNIANQIGWDGNSPLSFDQAVQLGLAAKQVTVDFSAAGSIGKIVNQVIPFFNAQVQGQRLFLKNFRDRPLRTVMYGLPLLAATIALWWDNKDEEWYKDMPTKEKMMYWNIKVGPTIIQIPRAFEYGNVFAVIPETFLNGWYEQDPESVKESLGHILDTMTPQLMPTTLNVAKEQWKNRIEFFDRPIVPKGEVDLLPGDQVGPGTTALAVTLGKYFPETVSPRRVDHLIRGIGGGAAIDVMKAVESVVGLKQTRTGFDPSDIFAIGKLFRPGGEVGYSSKAIDRFYAEYDRLELASKSKDPEVKKTAYRLSEAREMSKALGVIRDLNAQDTDVDSRKARTILMREMATEFLKESEESRKTHAEDLAYKISSKSYDGDIRQEAELYGLTAQSLRQALLRYWKRDGGTPDETDSATGMSVRKKSVEDRMNRINKAFKQ